MKKLEPESLFDLNFASHPVISDDGRLVACVVSSVNEDHKGYSSSIYVSRDGGPASAFTSGKSRDSHPVFSRDGSQIAFTSSRDQDKAQLFVVPTNGGEARQLTHLKSGVSSPKFSRDGKKIAFLSRGDWEDEVTKDGLPKIVNNLRYKLNGLPGAGILPDEPLNLWVLELTTNKNKKEPERVSKHETSIETFDWLPDGSSLVFTAATNDDQGAQWGSELFQLQLGKRRAKRLTTWGGLMTSIAVSPDGQRVAVIADADFATQPGDSHLYTIQLSKPKLTRVAPQLNVLAVNTVNSDSHFGSYPTGPYWVDNKTILCGGQNGGSGGIYEFKLGGQVQARLEPHHANIPTFATNKQGQLAYLLERIDQPPELHLDGQSVGQFNSSATLGDSEHITFERDGFTVEGWVLKPTKWKASKKHPVVLNVHGGPATAWGHAYMHEFQVLASQGYAVAFCNIRGSTGYGDAQTAGIGGQYLTNDFDDLMAFFDECLQRYSWLDGNRAAIIGGSYGGVMTNWTISHTNRFKAAITDRSICNWVSFFGSSDIGYRFTPRELRGVVPQDFERLWEMSPLKHVQNVNTPCLVVHSEEDHRCPIEQAEQWFVALKTQGVKTRFVRIPGENHELSRSGRPDRRAFRLQEYLDWLETHL